MRIVRFLDSDGSVQWGKRVDQESAQPIRGDLFGEHTNTQKPARIARQLAPAAPANIFAIGRNYREHVKEMKVGDAPGEPLIFMKATTSLIGPGDSIVLPHSAPSEVDFEAELAVIIGRAAKNVPEHEALSFVFGYTCANDVTARDCQKRRDKQWTRAKSFDTFCPLGPEIVTADELDPNGLQVRSILNGEVMQDGNTSAMIFPVATLISYLSHQFTLEPGTVLLTGTPSGVGFARDPQVFLKPGDEIIVEVEGIGRLINHVQS